jgi:hypothetical protein
MQTKTTLLHQEDVVNQGENGDLIPHNLTMPRTFKVEELRAKIEKELSRYWEASFDCSVLRHSQAGWQSGTITLRFSVDIEFQPEESESEDSLDELRNIDS